VGEGEHPERGRTEITSGMRTEEKNERQMRERERERERAREREADRRRVESHEAGSVPFSRSQAPIPLGSVVVALRAFP